MYDEQSWQQSEIHPHVEWAYEQVARYLPNCLELSDQVRQACDLYAAGRWAAERQSFSSWQLLINFLGKGLSRPQRRLTFVRYFNTLPDGLDKQFAWSVLYDSVENPTRWITAQDVVEQFLRLYLAEADPDWERPDVEFSP